MRWTRMPAALFVALFVAACADSFSTKPSSTALTGVASTASCTATLSSLLAQADTVFGAGSPNVNSVVGKINNLDHHLQNNQPEEAKKRAFEIVAFVLQKEREKDLAGNAEQIARFVNAIYCYAGLDITISDPANSWLISPNDSAQILVGLDSSTGISLPSSPVLEPSVITIERFEGRLNTLLDQYPGFVYIRLQSELNSGLTSAATVRVCATEVPSAEVLAALRLGHGIRDTGFVITPLPTAADPVNPTLACDQLVAPIGIAQRVMESVARLFAPRSAIASNSALRFLGGGVSGTVNEFSPFAPVDTELSFGGGVSGTVNEFLRTAPMSLEQGVSTLQSCSSISVGAGVPNECLPVVSIKTRTFGTPFSSVPVEWAVAELSGGTIAPRSGEQLYVACGTFGRTASTLTTAKGNAGVCWNVEGEGRYDISARASIGGDIPEGVTLSTDVVNFSLDVTPVTLSIVTGDGQTAAAGSVLPVPPTVRVLDANGQPAVGIWVDFVALANADASVTPASVRTNTSGEAWTSWTIGAGHNELRAMVRNAPDSTAVYFTANGSSGTQILNSCPVGGGRDPINNPSRLYGFWVPGPSNGTTMREVDLYFGASGKANRADVYNIALITQRGGGFREPAADTTIVPVELRGNASENKRATFRLRHPIVGRTGNPSSVDNAVTMRLVVLNQVDNATISFNTGPCSLGSCKVPRGCDATQVDLLTVTQQRLLGDVYRRSVGIEIRGN